MLSDGTEAWRVRWHRAWIERQRHEAEQRVKELAERTAEAQRAAQIAREAMKKRRVLERLRDVTLTKQFTPNPGAAATLPPPYSAALGPQHLAIGSAASAGGGVGGGIAAPTSRPTTPTPRFA